jgi:hypothetical protein
MNTVIKLVIEKDKETLWAWTANEDCFSPNTFGKTLVEVQKNIVDLIRSELSDPNSDKNYWNEFDFENIEWEISYNLEALFDEFKFLNISNVAKAAGINPSLMRQYASGIVNPSKKQTQKIEDTVHQLAHKMLEVSLV